MTLKPSFTRSLIQPGNKLRGRRTLTDIGMNVVLALLIGQAVQINFLIFIGSLLSKIHSCSMIRSAGVAASDINI